MHAAHSLPTRTRTHAPSNAPASAAHLPVHPFIDPLLQDGCLSGEFASKVLPIIYAPLHHDSAQHWNRTVRGLAQNVLNLYEEYDAAAFAECARSGRDRRAGKREDEHRDAQLWKALDGGKCSIRSLLAESRELDRRINRPGAPL